MNAWYTAAIYLLLIVVFLSFSVFSLIQFINNRKSKKQRSCFAVSLLFLLLLILFINSHRISYQYNDWLILHRHIDEVQNRYGAFDVGNRIKGEKGRVGYYIYTDNGPIMPDYLAHYYYMEYDEQGMIYQIYDGCQPGG